MSCCAVCMAGPDMASFAMHSRGAKRKPMKGESALPLSFLDILFANRNKEYGAYELRSRYPARIMKALAAGILLAGLALGLAMLGGNSTDSRPPDHRSELFIVPFDDKPLPPPTPPPPPPPPVAQTSPPAARIKSAEIRIVPDEQVQEPPPSREELNKGKIGLANLAGEEDDGAVQLPPGPATGRGILAAPARASDDAPVEDVDAPAQFPGGMQKWLAFLERHCRGQVASDRGAPEGVYTVIIQFVVDESGRVSQLVPLTSHGYGMEEEALRVLRKAAEVNWVPAVQRGRPVKAYRKQPITFVVKQEY